MGDADSGRGYLCVGAERIQGSLCFPLNFGMNLKYSLLKEKKNEQTGKRRGFIKMGVKKNVPMT